MNGISNQRQASVWAASEVARARAGLEEVLTAQQKEPW